MERQPRRHDGRPEPARQRGQQRRDQVARGHGDGDHRDPAVVGAPGSGLERAAGRAWGRGRQRDGERRSRGGLARRDRPLAGPRLPRRSRPKGPGGPRATGRLSSAQIHSKLVIVSPHTGRKPGIGMPGHRQRDPDGERPGRSERTQRNASPSPHRHGRRRPGGPHRHGLHVRQGPGLDLPRGHRPGRTCRLGPGRRRRPAGRHPGRGRGRRRQHDRGRGVRPGLHAGRRLRPGRGNLQGHLRQHREHPPRHDLRRRHEALGRGGQDRAGRGRDPCRRAVRSSARSRATSRPGWPARSPSPADRWPAWASSPPRPPPRAPRPPAAPVEDPNAPPYVLRDPKAPALAEGTVHDDRLPDHREGHHRRRRASSSTPGRSAAPCPGP